MKTYTDKHTAKNIWHRVHRNMRLIQKRDLQLLDKINKEDRETMRGRFNFTLSNQQGEIIGKMSMAYSHKYNALWLWRFWQAMRKACGKQATAQIQLFNLNIK